MGRSAANSQKMLRKFSVWRVVTLFVLGFDLLFSAFEGVLLFERFDYRLEDFIFRTVPELRRQLKEPILNVTRQCQYGVSCFRRVNFLLL